MKNKQYNIKYVFEDGTYVIFDCIASLQKWYYENDTLVKKYVIDFPTIEDKEKLFNATYPFDAIPQMNDDIGCLHCEEIYKVKECIINSIVVADKNDYFQIEHPFQIKGDDGGVIICCKNENCDGNAMDWVPPRVIKKQCRE